MDPLGGVGGGVGWAVGCWGEMPLSWWGMDVSIVLGVVINPQNALRIVAVAWLGRLGEAHSQTFWGGRGGGGCDHFLCRNRWCHRVGGGGKPPKRTKDRGCSMSGSIGRGGASSWF